MTAMHAVQVLMLTWPALLAVATSGLLWIALAQPVLPTSADLLWYLLQPLLLTVLTWLALGPVVLRSAGLGAIVDSPTD